MKQQTALLPLLLVIAFKSVDSSRTQNLVLFKRRSLNVADNDPLVCSSFGDSVGHPIADQSKVTRPVSMIKPCCVSWGPGRVDCFIRNKNNNIMHWSKQDGFANGWEQLDGVFIRNIECVSREKGSIDIFAVTHDGNVHVNSVDGFTNMWTGWKGIAGGRLMDAPSCAVKTPTEMDCVGVDILSRAFTINYKGGKWAGWVLRNLYTKYGCKSSYKTDGVTYFACVGNYSVLEFSNVVGTKWNTWANLGGNLITQPEVKSMNKYRIDVLAVSQKNHLLHLAWVDNVWQKWMNLGGSIVDAPSCLIVGSSFHCFVVGVDSYLYRLALEDGKWSPWISLGGTFIEGPSCVLSDPKKKEISCYLRGLDKKIVEKILNV